MSKINTDKFILDEQTSDIEIADISGVFKLDPAKIDAAAVLAGDAAPEDAGHKLVKESALKTEVDARAAADSQLTSDLASEVSRASTAEAGLQAGLDGEIAARTAQGNTLGDLIDDEQQRAETAEAGLDGKIDQEIADRTAAVSAENTAMLAAVAAVQADVDQNEADSDAAESALSARLDTVEGAGAGSIAKAQADAQTFAEGKVNDEAAARLAADNTLGDLIQAEEDRAVAAETGLQSSIDGVAADLASYETSNNSAVATERARIDAILDASEADKDSFAEIVTLINSVDLANDDALAAAVLSINADVAAVQADVDANESDADAAMAQEVQDRTDGDAAERAFALAARNEMSTQIDAGFATLDAKIEDEEDAREAADTALELAVRKGTNPTSFAGSMADLSDAIDAVQADVDQNESDADAAITAEADARLAADNTLGDLIQAEEDRASAAEASLLADLNAEIAATNANFADAAAARTAIDNAYKAADLVLQGNIDALAADLASEISSTNVDFASASASRAAIQSDVDANEQAASDDRAAIRQELSDEVGLLIGSAGEGYDDMGLLEDKIKREELRIDAILDASEADKDSFAEIVTLVNSIDAENDTAFAGHVVTFNAAVASLEGADSALQSELDGTQTGAGLGDNGAYTANNAMKIIDTATSIVNATELLDGRVSDLMGGEKLMELMGDDRHGETLMSEFTAFVVTSADRAYNMDEQSDVQRKVVNAGTHSVQINAPEGTTFMNNAASITIHPSQSAVMIRKGDKVYLF